MGVTWNEATIVDFKTMTDLYFSYYCGGGIWLANGEYNSDEHGKQAGFVSFDDAQTWYQAAYVNGAITSSGDVEDVACNGAMLVMYRDDNRIVHTLAIPGSMNG